MKKDWFDCDDIKELISKTENFHNVDLSKLMNRIIELEKIELAFGEGTDLIIVDRNTGEEIGLDFIKNKW